MFNLQVTLDSQKKPFEVTADARDVRAWEAAMDKSWFANEGVSLTDITWLAFNAARRSGKYQGSWDDFNAECSRVEEVGDPTPVDPTQKEASDDS